MWIYLEASEILWFFGNLLFKASCTHTCGCLFVVTACPAVGDIKLSSCNKNKRRLETLCKHLKYKTDLIHWLIVDLQCLKVELKRSKNIYQHLPTSEANFVEELYFWNDAMKEIFYFAIICRRNPPKIALPCRARPCLEQFPPAVTNINQIQTKTANFPQDFRKWAETGKGKLLRKKLARLKHAKCAVQLRFVFHKKQRIQQKTKPWLAVVFFRE